MIGNITHKSTTTIAALGAAFMTAGLLAYANPALAGEGQSVTAKIEKSIDSTLRLPSSSTLGKKGIATLAIRIDARGAVETVSLVRSSGDRAFDREALRTARETQYPALGKPRLVAMVLGFNRSVTAADADRGEQLVQAFDKSREQPMLAGEATARPAS